MFIGKTGRLPDEHQDRRLTWKQVGSPQINLILAVED